MNKKALAMKTLVELILFAVITILIALPLLTKMVGFFIEEPETGTKKSLEALAIEINNLDKEKTMPVYVDKDHFIAGYKVDETKPRGSGCEEGGACLCICNIKEKCVSQDRIECKKLEFDLKGDVEIKPKLVDDDGNINPKKGKPTVQNCVLNRDDKGVTISCS